MKIDVHYYEVGQGYKSLIPVDIHKDLEVNILLINSLGLRFTAEYLRTDDISVCIENPEYGDFDIEIVHSHSDGIASSFEKMIDRFTYANYTAWLSEQFWD